MSDVSSKKIKDTFKPILRLSGPDDGVLDESFARIVDSGTAESVAKTADNGVYVSTNGGGIKGTVKLLVDGFCMRPVDKGEEGIPSGDETSEGSLIFYGMEQGGKKMVLTLRNGQSLIELKDGNIKIDANKVELKNGGSGETDFGSGNFKFASSTIGKDGAELGLGAGKSLLFRFEDNAFKVSRPASGSSRIESVVPADFQAAASFKGVASFTGGVSISGGGFSSSSKAVLSGGVETSSASPVAFYGKVANAQGELEDKKCLSYDPSSNILTVGKGVSLSLEGLREDKVSFGGKNFLSISSTETVAAGSVLGALENDGLIRPVPLSSFKIEQQASWPRTNEYTVAPPFPAAGWTVEIPGRLVSVCVWRLQAGSPGADGFARVLESENFSIQYELVRSTVSKRLVSVLKVAPKTGTSLNQMYEVGISYRYEPA